MRVRRIVETFHQRMPLQRRLNDSPLHPSTTAVNQSHLSQPRLVRGADILFHDRLDVLGSERVEIDRIFDRDIHRCYLLPFPFSLLPFALFLVPCPFRPVSFS